MTQKLISQGAEAKIFLVSQAKNSKAEQDNKKTPWVGGQDAKPKAREKGEFEKPIILKSRIPKSYRHPILDDQIRTRRTKSEAKILTRALEIGAKVPRVLNTNQKGIPNHKHNLEIEFIEGDRLSETLNSYPQNKQFHIMEQIGTQVAILHKNNIIHGDLTTSNTILQINIDSSSQNKQSKLTPKGREENSKNFQSGDFCDSQVFIIDFGLGFISSKIEDKAVDLHLIKQALEAKHYQNHEDLFDHFKKGYIWEESDKILQRLEVVEKRGRNKH